MGQQLIRRIRARLADFPASAWDKIRHPTRSWLFRAFCGGRWEETRSCGWYRYDHEGRVPPGVLSHEDHRDDCWPIRLLVLLTLVLTAWAVCT